MSNSLTTALQSATGDVDRVRTELSVADVRGVGVAGPATDLYRSVRGVAYVRLAAILEAFLNATIEYLVQELNRKTLRPADLHLGLLSLVENPAFDSLQEVRGLKMWKQRAELLRRTAESSVAQFPADVAPLDGRTLRPVHFETLWEVFGFSPPVLPGPFHKLALIELADLRNALAHGDRTPAEVAKLKGTQDVVRLCGRVDEVAVHVASAAENFLVNRLYLR